jgi:hypothetical protein
MIEASTDKHVYQFKAISYLAISNINAYWKSPWFVLPHGNNHDVQK